MAQITASSKKQSLRQDIFAGLTAATVIIPKAMAYATVAGLTVSVGLYTALVPLLVYAVLGTSRVLSVTSTTTLGILTAAEVTQLVPDGDLSKVFAVATTLTILVGVFLLIAAILRFGFIANFISTPVLIGFKAGIGLVIVLDQAPKLLGLHIAKQGFFQDAASLVTHLPDYSLMSLLVASGTFLLFFLLKKFAPQSPVSLIVVASSILASWLLNLQSSGVAIVGQIPQGLPPLTLPDLSLIQSLIPGALGIALMSFTESIAVARAFHKTGEPPINSNRELIATGAANAIGGLFGAMPCGGGTSQTAVVRAAGGSSQKTSIVVALASAATMLLLAPALAVMPYPTLAAIVIIFSVGLIEVKEFKEVRKIRNMEFRWALGACLGVLLFGTLKGIVIAIIMSLVGLSSQTANLRVSVLARKRGTNILRPYDPEKHPDDQLFERLLILRPEGRVFFLNAQNISVQITNLLAQYKPDILLMDMSRVPDLEYSALKMFIDGDQRLTSQGGIQWLAALNPNVLEVVRKSGWDKTLGSRLFFNAEVAIDHYFKVIKPKVNTPPYQARSELNP
ncbi:SulP family inorganic anion transporter [Bdellovibrio svalbardensis]|uniref:SulP family inorganic anion transporter n=1 Tax=Bdellovibrio svalbardensis TaxID=2972972 RepID=A0ABT6DMZ4_9BACT|nr:SulP family inorganic anion transporter [Bdellovibrio svalbardensis]